MTASVARAVAVFMPVFLVVAECRSIVGVVASVEAVGAVPSIVAAASVMATIVECNGRFREINSG